VDLSVGDTLEDFGAEVSPGLPGDALVDEAAGLGDVEIGGVLDQPGVGEQEARRGLVQDPVATHDVRNVGPVQKLVLQPLDVDHRAEPGEVEPGFFCQDNVPAQHSLVVERADVALSAGVP